MRKVTKRTTKGFTNAKDKKHKTVLGITKQHANGSWYLEPIERRGSKVRVDPPKNLKIEENSLVRALISPDKTHKNKKASIKKVFGKINSAKDLSLIALIEHGIPYIFSDDLLKDLPKKEEDLKESMLHEDWTHLPFVTIDPKDARDMDDAVYAQADPNHKNGFILFVAIADVAYYVAESSKLDKEACERSQSIYFPDRVVPMLPEVLSSDLCSLRKEKPRYALAVKIFFDGQGHKTKYTFHRVKIKVADNLSYEEVEKCLKHHKGLEPIKPLLQTLSDVYKLLKNCHKKRESLHINLPERKIIFNSKGDVDSVVLYPSLESHKLIEEFMIQANICAAEMLHLNEHSFLYRIHEEPPSHKKEMLYRLAERLKISLPLDLENLTPQIINQILEEGQNTTQQELVHQIVLRSQSQAEYSMRNIGHFGLQLEKYTHFTSPIRRYVDLLIHRGIIKTLQKEASNAFSQPHMDLRKTANKIALNEKRALSAERDTFNRLIAYYLRDKLQQTFQANISGINSAGIFITIEKIGAQGFIPLSSLRNGYYHLDEVNHYLIDKPTLKGYQLGDKIETKLIELSVYSGSLRFKMLSPPHKLVLSTKEKTKPPAKAAKYKKRKRS